MNLFKNDLMCFRSNFCVSQDANKAATDVHVLATLR